MQNSIFTCQRGANSSLKPTRLTLVALILLVSANSLAIKSVQSQRSALVQVINRSINRIKIELSDEFSGANRTFDSLHAIGNNDNQEFENQNNEKQLTTSKRGPPNRLTSFNPVIFIPGDGGSQLEAKLNKTTRVHYICALQSDWYDLWLNIHLLAPQAFDCLIDNMMLHFDNVTKTTFNTPGVQIRPTNFGNLSSVSWLDIYHIYKTDYFDEIITTLEKNNGLVREVDMIGAAFDFRKAPNELEIFFTNLTRLIERHYVMNNYRPVTLICHSMGCLNSLYLLNRKSQNWKDVFVRRLITLAAPWHGSFKAISAMLYGDNLGIPLLNHKKLQVLQASFPSLMYLFPREPTFSSDRILVETKEMNYTLKNLDLLFKGKKMDDQLEMWELTRKIASNLTAPNVELWCLYGSGQQTPSKIVYQGPLDGDDFKEIYDDGDGTVNLESLKACEEFSQQQEKPVYTRMFEGVDHIDILRGHDAADFISNRIMTSDLI